MTKTVDCPFESARSSASVGDEDAGPTLGSQMVRDRLFRLAYRLVWSRDEAEDVVQDALLAAHTGRSTAGTGGQRWAWLYRIVVRKCFDAGRRRKRRARHEEALARLAVDAADPAPADSRADRQLLVRRLIQTLPRRQREVLTLRHLQEMSFEEIGEVLSISAATARVHAKAGREALRDRLIEAGYFA